MLVTKIWMPFYVDTCRLILPRNGGTQLSPEISQISRPQWELLSTSVVDETLVSSINKPLPFSKAQVFEFIEHFRCEVDCFYPFIPFDSLTSLTDAVIDRPGIAQDPETRIKTEDWDDALDSRNLDLLRLTLACAVVAKTKIETEASRHLMSSASENITTKWAGLNFDSKDVAIAALIGIYHLQCDETVLAWRKISTAAKMCQELELHKSVDGRPSWILRLFWCIYVLDKRLSFMANLPFTLHDADIEHMIPDHDSSLRYISSLIKYLRIAARFVPTMPKLGRQSICMEPSTRTSLDIQTEHWALSAVIDNTSAPDQGPSDRYGRAEKDQFNSAFTTVCRNQLKMALYKHSLFSLETIVQNTDLSHEAVASASDTIQSCNKLQATTVMYHLQAVHFNYFVLSAVAALYLAVRHAPLEFNTSFKNISIGLDILKNYRTSGRLNDRVQALETAMKRLGYDPIGLGPQLGLNDTLSSHQRSPRLRSDWFEDPEVSDELIPFTPMSSLVSHIQPTAESRNYMERSNTPSLSLQQWMSWENDEWIT